MLATQLRTPGQQLWVVCASVIGGFIKRLLMKVTHTEGQAAQDAGLRGEEMRLLKCVMRDRTNPQYRPTLSLNPLMIGAFSLVCRTVRYKPLWPGGVGAGEGIRGLWGCGKGLSWRLRPEASLAGSVLSFALLGWSQARAGYVELQLMHGLQSWPVRTTEAHRVPARFLDLGLGPSFPHGLSASQKSHVGQEQLTQGCSLELPHGKLAIGYGAGTVNHLNAQNLRDGQESDPVARDSPWSLKPSGLGVGKIRCCQAPGLEV